MACERLTESSAKQLLGQTDNFLFDCDGVLWDERGVIPGSIETIKKLRSMGKKVFFITNNSLKTQEQYLKKFQDFGFHVTLDEIVCTAYAAAMYLKHRNFTGKVYVVGSEAMGKELDKCGIRHTGIGPMPLKGNPKEWINIKLDPEVKCVLVGFDFDFTYMKIMMAVSYLQNPDTLFLATNEDTHLPVSDSQIRIPDTIAMIAGVKFPAQREPIILGKPEKHMFELLKKHHNLNPARCVMVGDRLNTDMGLAKICGLKSLLVLSGCTKESNMQLVKSGSPVDTRANHLPDFYTGRLADLLRAGL